MFYPVFLNLQNKRVVVVGGGEVAERKVESLLETGALITVVRPTLTSKLDGLAQANRIHILRRRYADGDCDGAAFVFTATDDPKVSAEVYHAANQSGALVNTADQPALCDFILPAVARQGDIAIAVSTGGTSPGLAARLRDKIAEI